MNNQPTPDTSCAVLSLYSMWIFGTSLITWHNKMQSLQTQTLHHFLQNLEQNTTVSVTHNKDMCFPGLHMLSSQQNVWQFVSDLKATSWTSSLGTWRKTSCTWTCKEKKMAFLLKCPWRLYVRLNRTVKCPKQVTSRRVYLDGRATTTWFFVCKSYEIIEHWYTSFGTTKGGILWLPNKIERAHEGQFRFWS